MSSTCNTQLFALVSFYSPSVYILVSKNTQPCHFDIVDAEDDDYYFIFNHITSRKVHRDQIFIIILRFIAKNDVFIVSSTHSHSKYYYYIFLLLLQYHITPADRENWKKSCNSFRLLRYFNVITIIIVVIMYCHFIYIYFIYLRNRFSSSYFSERFYLKRHVFVVIIIIITIKNV